MSCCAELDQVRNELSQGGVQVGVAPVLNNVFELFTLYFTLCTRLVLGGEFLGNALNLLEERER